MNGMWVAAIIVIIIIAPLIKDIINTYNLMVTKRNEIKSQRTYVYIQINKKAQIIPLAIKCVQGYTIHERETLEGVVRARGEALKYLDKQETARAEELISISAPKVFSLKEKYPELKADKMFMQLQQEMVDAEEKIANAKAFYNDAVSLYNTLVQTFPNNMMAGLLGFKAEKYMGA